MSEKVELAVEFQIAMVADLLAKRNGWSQNEALSRMTKTTLYPLLADSSTELWMDNPSDIADYFEIVFAGKTIDPATLLY